MAEIAPDLVNTHTPGPECGDTHCYMHHVDESPVDAWRICFECGHVYPTPENLQREWTENAPPDMPGRETPPPVQHIHFCPLCVHDW